MRTGTTSVQHPYLYHVRTGTTSVRHPYRYHVRIGTTAVQHPYWHLEAAVAEAALVTLHADRITDITLSLLLPAHQTRTDSTSTAPVEHQRLYSNIPPATAASPSAQCSTVQPCSPAMRPFRNPSHDLNVERVVCLRFLG